MKNIIIKILIAVLCFSSIMVFASCGNNNEGSVDSSSQTSSSVGFDWENPNLTFDKDNANFKFVYDEEAKGYKVTEYIGKSEYVEIPSSHVGVKGEHPVTKIGWKAFFYSDSPNREDYDASKFPLLAVKIPDSVTIIDDWAFGYQSKITEFIIPNSVNFIGKAAFNGCSSLEKITIPFVGNEYLGTENTYFGYIFGADSYNSNPNVLPENLTHVVVTKEEALDDYAFAYCRGFKSLVLPNTLKSIGERGLFYLSGIKSLEIPSSVTSLGDSCLNGMSTLENLTLPFLGSSLLDYSISHIGYIFGAPKYTNNSQYMPNTLTTVTLTKQVKLTEGAFYNVDSLNYVNIPSTCEEISDLAFQGCDNLKLNESKGVYYLPYGEDKFGLAITSNKNIKNAEIEPTCKMIMADCFASRLNLETVSIPNGVKCVGANAFYRCSGLKEITIPNSVETIGDNAFYENRALEKINISKQSNVGYIGAFCFYNCENLKSINMPIGLSEIGKSAFLGCTNLTNVYFYTFSNYPTIEFGNIYSTPFAHAVAIYLNDEKIEAIQLPETVIRINSYAFSNLNCIKSISMPNSLVRVEVSAFCGMNGGVINFTKPKSSYIFEGGWSSDCQATINFGESVN